MTRRFVFLVMTLFCASMTSVAMGQDLKVGTLFDHTGALKEWGPNHQNAAQLVAKQLAAAELEIQFIHEDSGTDAQKAMGAARKLDKTDKVAASLYKTASVMYVNNAYGQGLARQFRRSFQKRGGIVFTMIPHGEKVAKSYINDLHNAFTPVFSTKPYISGKSDVLCVFSYPEHAKVYVKEAIERFGAKHFLFCDGIRSEELAKVVGAENLEGMMGTAPAVSGGESFANFSADYKAELGSLPTIPFIANAYDATAVIGLAAYAAKVKGLPLTSRNIRDQLRLMANPPGKFIGAGKFKQAFALLEKGQEINYEGASGPVDFDEKGDVLAPIEIWKYSRGGPSSPIA